MCGIAAIYSYRSEGPLVSADELVKIRQAMTLRGPDGAGLWVSEERNIGLAHRRLAIVDLTENGAQPMTTKDGRLSVTFNGEIYNYRELRARLTEKGHAFFSDSDTEVLLHAYREYGQDMVDHLRGMFAFAIWDQEIRGLFLGRDHFGIKPLYYHDDGKSIRVASQVKALLAGGAIQPDPEPAGLVGFYLWGCVPEPYTLYHKLFALPAGHTLWVDQDGPRAPKRYFDLAETLGTAASQQARAPVEEALRNAVKDSVKHHLIADVPVGVFLSAGLDSATLTALSAEEVTHIQAITLGFTEYKNTLDDETPLAGKIAAHYACRHQIAHIDQRDFAEDLPAILQAMDQPSIDGINTYFVARAAARAGLKVALSGVGGDELLGGYPSFRHVPQLVRRVRPIARPPGIGKVFRWVSAPILKHTTSPKFASLFEYGGSYGGAYLLRRGLFMPWELPQFLGSKLVREGWAKLRPIARMDEWVSSVEVPHAKVTALETAFYMRNMLLRDSDWAGMAHSLEIRTPLVDIALFRTMAPYLCGTGAPPSKRQLAQCARIALPDAVLNRPKTGFCIPVAQWLNTQGTSKQQRGLRGWATRVMDDFTLHGSA
ncbi:asparagine synthase (glutamine-hydrolyzing) [Burkholderia sp. MSMB1589WGS]|uniref:asparagine synthase (glutamine-hydrolyzing) n=1 Tax=Burkholderia sp. MSMB1589WGS TaxID=1636425 RepID=UPI0007B9C945|nr:asparagine synthase (glutamine-hydrolyzing) [Burkholderia sp. MSMB1589WGS]